MLDDWSCEISLQKRDLWGLNRVGKRPRTVHGIQIGSLNHDRPPSMTPSMCLEEVHSFWQYVSASVY